MFMSTMPRYAKYATRTGDSLVIASLARVGALVLVDEGSARCSKRAASVGRNKAALK